MHPRPMLVPQNEVSHALDLFGVGNGDPDAGRNDAAAAQSPAIAITDRATRHFLNSRYSYRTLYSSVPAPVARLYTPFLYQNQYVEPSYSKHA